MNKCEKCSFLHYRTDPCRMPKEKKAHPDETLRRTKAGLVVGPSAKSMAPSESRTSRSRSANENLPVDMSSPDVLPSPVAKSEKPQGDIGIPKFDKKTWMRDYMREHRRGIRRRAAK